ncbi:MAG: 50S ribosomal protein L24 [SAR202 cluster bacterium]|nr:50S ribosomal protein L24 [SAR202 cluster bacterium]
MNVRKEDTVLVLRGRDRGKQGKVQQVLPKHGKVLVEGVNMVSRHAKASATVRQAGIIQKEMPLLAANVMLVCTHCSKPTRVGHRKLADGTKARVCKQCKEVIE